MLRVACAAIVCGSIAAHAEPRTDPTVGRAVFTGAATPSAPALELDPAALALDSHEELYFASSLLFDHYSIQRKTLNLDTGALSPGDSAHSNELGAGAIAEWVKPLRDVTFAIALESVPVELFPSGQAALGYHTLGDDERMTYAFTIGGGVKLTDELMFGLSLSAQKRQLHLRYLRDTALANGHGPGGLESDCGGGVACGIENPAAAETYDVQVESQLLSTDTLVANIGLLWIITPTTFLAVSYHSPPGLAVENTLTGDMTVTRAPRDGGITLHGDATVNVSEPASVDAELRMRLPQQLDLHVGFRWEDLSRFGAYDVRGYGSTFFTYNIPEWTERPRGFHDPFAVWAGVEQIDKGEPLRFGGRLGIETSSVDDNTTSPMAIDPTSFTFDGGAQLRLSDRVLLQATYGLQYFPKVSVTNSAFDPRAQIECIASGYDYSTMACEQVRLGYGIPTADGDYQRIEQAFRIAIRVLLP